MPTKRMQSKHVPQRTCVVCRRTLSKRDLHRIVRTPDGVVIDPTGKLAGRGAYLCSDPVCWQKAAQGSALDRALKTNLNEEERRRIALQGDALAPQSES